MHVVRTQVLMLVVLLVIAATGCPCVYAGLFQAAPGPDAPQVAAAADVECPYCCCGRTHEQPTDDSTPSPSRPPPPCSKRAHGEGLAPDLDIDMGVHHDAPLLAVLLPADLTMDTCVPKAPRAQADRAVPRPPDELRRGIVLRN